MPDRISATVICHNEERRIASCISSLSFCDEVIVVDSFSTDHTAEIAASMGAKVFRREYRGTNDQKEHARTLATGDWIVNLDGDEAASEGCGDEVRKAVSEGAFAAFDVPFVHFIGEKRLRFGRFRCDRHVRVFRRASARYDPSVEPHDRLVVNGRTGRLASHVIHYTYEDIADAAEKAERYGRLAARRMALSGVRVSRFRRFFSPPWRFFKEAFLGLGILDGADGLRLAVLSAREAGLKYGPVEPA